MPTHRLPGQRIPFIVLHRVIDGRSVVEIYVVIMMAMFGNYFNHLVKTESDFLETK